MKLWSKLSRPSPTRDHQGSAGAYPEPRGRPLQYEDVEEIAQKLAALVASVSYYIRDKKQNDNNILKDYWSFLKMKEFGEQIAENGGLERMKDVWQQVATIERDSHLLDMAWDGIGGWRR